MPHKPIAIVAAMRTELAPLLHGLQPTTIDGVELFELPFAVVAVSGIGRGPAEYAASVAVRYAQPELLVSAGFAGALLPELKIGDVEPAREVVDCADGNRYATQGGKWSVVTAMVVAGADDKQELQRRFHADVVDMEGAAVAQVAQEHGIRFSALKAVSDELDFPMPPFARFVGNDGKLAKGRLLAYVVVRPGLWPVMVNLGRNSRVASEHLSRAVQHLIGSYVSSAAKERVSPGVSSGAK